MSVERVAPDGEAQACALLAEAFSADPFVSWMYPDARTRRESFGRLMRRLVAITRPYHRLLRTSEAAGACALWIPPGHAALGRRDSLRMIPELPRMGVRLPNILLALDALDRQHPREPHWYLFVVGSHPGERGRGHGRAVIQPVTRRGGRRSGTRVPRVDATRRMSPTTSDSASASRSALRTAGSPPMIPMWSDPR